MLNSWRTRRRIFGGRLVERLLLQYLKDACGAQGAKFRQAYHVWTGDPVDLVVSIHTPCISTLPLVSVLLSTFTFLIQLETYYPSSNTPHSLTISQSPLSLHLP